MIERQKINGRDATISYLGDGFQPAEKAHATNIKVVFDDGDVVFLTADVPQPDIERLKAQRDDLEQRLAEINRMIDEANAPKDPLPVQEEAAVWLAAITTVDATEIKLRDIIERGLSEVAGLPHLRARDAVAATAAVMRKVGPLRAKAIKAAFREVRQQVGNAKVYGKSPAVWAQMITAADTSTISEAIRSGLLGGLSHMEISRKVVGSSGLNGVDGVTEMTRHKIAHVGRASIKQNRGKA